MELSWIIIELNFFMKNVQLINWKLFFGLNDDDSHYNIEQYYHHKQTLLNLTVFNQ